VNTCCRDAGRRRRADSRTGNTANDGSGYCILICFGGTRGLSLVCRRAERHACPVCEFTHLSTGTFRICCRPVASTHPRTKNVQTRLKMTLWMLDMLCRVPWRPLLCVVGDYTGRPPRQRPCRVGTRMGAHDGGGCRDGWVPMDGCRFVGTVTGWTHIIPVMLPHLADVFTLNDS
jgi:hypothetical protein